MGLKRTTDAAIEPISLAEAKQHLYVDTNDQDALITLLIKRARMWAEEFTRRAFIEQTWQLTLDEFPAAGNAPPPGERAAESFSGYRRGIIRLERPRLISVTSIKYTDVDGNLNQTLSSSLYQVETGSDIEARILPAYACSWPATRYQMECVQVIYKAGYGDEALDVPEAIKQAILLQLGTYFSQRENIAVDGPKSRLPTNATAEVLLEPYCVWSAAC